MQNTVSTRRRDSSLIEPLEARRLMSVTVDHFSEFGEGASAGSYIQDDSHGPEPVVSIFFAAADEVEFTTNGVVTPASYGEAFIEVIDLNTNQHVIYASADTPLTLDLSPNLKTAHITGVISTIEEVTGNPITINLDITLTAVTELSTKYFFGGPLSEREAAVTGTATISGLEPWQTALAPADGNFLSSSMSDGEIVRYRARDVFLYVAPKAALFGTTTITPRVSVQAHLENSGKDDLN